MAAGYTLLGRKRTGSLAVEAALALAGVPYTIRDVDKASGEQTSDAFTRLNPRQQVPTLILPDGSAMGESAAMLLHLADAFPAAQLAPPPGSPARAQHDRWLIFLAVNVYEGELRHYYPERYTADPAGIAGVEAAAIAYVIRHYELIEAAIGAGPFFFGATPTVVDLYLLTLTDWIDPDVLATRFPKVKRLAEAAAALPRVAPVVARHMG